MDVLLSPITPADRPAMLDLFNYYVEHGFSAFAEQPQPPALIARLLDLAQGYPALTAKDLAGRLLGFGLLRPHNPLPTFAHTSEIAHFLAPDRLREGIGTRLLPSVAFGRNQNHRAQRRGGAEIIRIRKNSCAPVKIG